MVGTLEVSSKEFSDHLTSRRSLILFAIVYLIGISMSFEAIASIRSEFQRSTGYNLFLKLFTTQYGVVPSFTGVLVFTGPLIGLLLVFDSMNREISSGTLGNTLSQPVHRDSVIVGKFIAGSLTTLLMLTGAFSIMVGMGIMNVGALPTSEEVLRITAYLIVSSVYLSLWVALGLLYSIYFKREGTAALASVATWLFFTLFIYMIIDITVTANIFPFFSYVSPTFLYDQAATALMIPEIRVTGPVSYERIIGMLPNPLPFGQSVLLIWPHLIALSSIMLLLFAVSYIKFVKQEIRST
jgi:ABC-2 type transport system permease protein